MTRSLRAWHEERRRLAQDLHDGVVQDLSAVSYSLPTVTSALPDTPEGSAARSTVDRMTGLLQQDLHALRTMVLDLMPTDLLETGLAAALVSLAERYTDDNLDISVEVEEGLDLDEDVTGVVYRVVREGLRNVQKHARAGHARVTVSQDADTVVIVLTDDGRGLEPHARRRGLRPPAAQGPGRRPGRDLRPVQRPGWRHGDAGTHPGRAPRSSPSRGAHRSALQNTV